MIWQYLLPWLAKINVFSRFKLITWTLKLQSLPGTLWEENLPRFPSEEPGVKASTSPHEPCPWTPYEWVHCHTRSKPQWIRKVSPILRSKTKTEQTNTAGRLETANHFICELIPAFKVILFYIISPVLVFPIHPISNYWVLLWWGGLLGDGGSAKNKTWENTCPPKLPEEGVADGIASTNTHSDFRWL